MAKGLGKGINALFANIEVEASEKVQEIELNEIQPNPYQPRKVFTQEAIDELKDSIIQHGVLQPIIVRKNIKGYEIVVGERRFRASKAAKRNTIPAVVREFDEQQMMELAILENLQREDLNPIEEAIAYQTLLERIKLTQDELAKRLGKSRPHIANHVRLLTLPKYLQEYMTEGKLTMGHGRALLGLKQKGQLKALAERTIAEGLNVRQLEKLVQQLNENVPRETKRPEKKNIFIKEHENLLKERFGTNVMIKQTKNKGKIEIEFVNEEDLQRILELLD